MFLPYPRAASVGSFIRPVGSVASTGYDLYVYGYNRLGEYGNGKADFMQTPFLSYSSNTVKMAPSSSSISSDVFLLTTGNEIYTSTSVGGWSKFGTASNWLKISSGGEHYNGIRSDGTLWAWGYNSAGLGDGINTSSSEPVKIGTGTAWSDIECGARHSLALKTDGTLWGWGDNAYGQIGDGSKTNRSTPVQIGTGTAWNYITATSYTSHALRTNKTMWGWGDNAYGQIGDGTTTQRSSPIQIGTGTAWIKVKNGHAIKTDNTLWGWGRNLYGEIGDGSTTTRSSPVQIGTGTAWYDIGTVSRSVFTYTRHRATIKTDGTVWVSGNFELMSSGIYSGNTYYFRQIPNLSGVTYFSYSEYKSLYIAGGTLYALGQSDANPITNGGLQSQFGGFTFSQTNKKWKKIISNRSGSAFGFITSPKISVFGIDDNDYLYGWGENRDELSGGYSNTGMFLGTSANAVETLSPVQIGTSKWNKISAGYNHILAIKSDGTLWSWGYNDVYQLGDGTTTKRREPIQIGTDNTWTEVSAGYKTSHAIKSNGTLWAWGWNNYSNLGNGTSTNITSPTQIGSNTTWSKINSGLEHTIALRSDGTLWGWGTNAYGQIGDGSTTTRSSPVQIGTDTNWTKISVGSYHNFAIKSTGSLWAWGANYSGQFGNGTTTNSLSPIQIGTDTTWSDVSAGDGSVAFSKYYYTYSYGAYSYGLKSDGTFWKWGVSATIPTQVGSDTNWKSVPYPDWSNYSVFVLKS